MNFMRTKPEPADVKIEMSEFTALILRDFLSNYTNPSSDELDIYKRLACLHNSDMEDVNAALVIVEEMLTNTLEE